MANVSSMKAVRTKYRNTLDKENTNAKVIVSSDISKTDINTLLQGASMCLNLLRTYSSKLEEQMGKLSTLLMEKEADLASEIVDDDCHLIFETEKNIFDLKQLIDSVQEGKMKSEIEETKHLDKESDKKMQEEMQKLILLQLEQQREFFEKQEKKYSTDKDSVKLPKLDLFSFNGNRLHWAAFWDSFECTVHKNKKLSNIEKFSYLLNKLYGEAKRAVAGLALSNENYALAIGILKERFGNEQEIVDMHYNELMNIPLVKNNVDSLKTFVDSLEKHLRSLEVLKENVNQHVFVSMIRSKLPQDVLRQLELKKGSKQKWTVQILRDELHEYVAACDHSQVKTTGTINEQKVRRDVKHPPYNVRQRDNFQRSYRQRDNYQEPSVYKSQYSTEPVFTNNLLKSKKPNWKRDQCRYCDKNHYSDECPKYRTIDERQRRIKGSCFKCLRDNHTISECKWNKTCVYCGEQNTHHHRSLCPKKFKYKTKLESASLSEEVYNDKALPDTPTENAMVSSSEMVLMQTASTDVKNGKTGASQQVRILLDCGSQRTYITQRLADTLGLKGEKEENIKLITFGNKTPTIVKTKSTTLCLKLNDGTYMEIQANIVPVIGSNIERKQVDITSNNSLKHLVKSLDLADTFPNENEHTSIELLIGNDYYLDLILPQRIEIQSGLYLLGSKLGWILTGRTQDKDIYSESASMLILTYGNDVTERSAFQCVDNTIKTKPDIQDFWNIEAIGITDNPSLSDDEKAMTNFQDTLIFQDGRYQVTWPWREENPALPVNRELAYGRLKSCLNRMKSKPDLMIKYDMVIKDQLEKGMIEMVDNTMTENKQHYIPHHAVLTLQKTTTKLRVVYDASAKTRPYYKSLNECLLRGPVMLHNLCGILMRFRLHEIALIADIEKAFLQIGLQQSQRDVTRFMWIKDINNPNVYQDNIQEYRFCRVPFGIISSPFLLGATIEAHLGTYTSDKASKLKRDIYVDNIVTGTKDESEAIELYKDAKSIFNDASMNLREWLSNSDVVNKCVSTSDRAEIKETNVLGHIWNNKNDTLAIRQVKFFNLDKSVTKRSILKVIASVFDPLGLFTPVSLKGKLLLQKLWSRKVDWDDPVEDDNIKTSWFSLCSDLEKLSKYPINRCVGITTNERDVVYRLMCFCDASSTAYSAATYLHQEQENQFKVNLMFAKSRLAPIKGMTIPRLELMAVVIGVRCLTFVTEQLQLPIVHKYLWTDSKCVLDWMNSDKHLPVFIKNRVEEIKSHKDVTISYVNTQENSADIATRGSTIEDLYGNQIWWHGPTWLLRDFEAYVKYSLASNEGQNDTSNNECNMISVNKTKTEIGNNPPFQIDIEAYSSFTKLLRVTALVLRFIRKLRREHSETGTIKHDEIQKAENMWLLHIQKKHFQDVFEGFAKGKPTNLQTQLGLYMDEFGILRSKGRLEFSCLSEGAKYPILLPRKDRFTTLIVEKTHKQLLHTGVSQTLSGIRYKYWIPHGRATVRNVVSSCNVCRRYEGGPYKMPLMPSIPKFRVNKSKPFSYTGLDYMGPLLIKCVDGPKKIWICLFTCLVTRAIHLEVVLDMSTEEFIMCFRRFISQRGTPIQIISDNAAQFKSANYVINKSWYNVIRDEDVQSYVSTAGIHWSFIVELAPWMGGFYERLIGLVKRALRKVIGRNLLTLIQFQTLLKEVESVVNSRPLTYIGDDINSHIALTPSHFLTLNPTTGLPEQELDENDNDYIPKESTRDNLLKLWKKGQKLLNSFWKMWREDYVMSLRERMQSSLKAGKLRSPFQANIGDTVLLKDDLPRGCWRLGLIVGRVLSHDNNVRSVKVKLASGRVLNRPLNLLYPLECSHQEHEETKPNTSSYEKNSYEVLRPVRQAAIRAKNKIKSINL